MASDLAIPSEAVKLVSEWPPDVQAAFAAYLDLPDGSRSLAALASGDGMPALRTLARWSADYGWQDIARGIIRSRAALADLETFEHLALNARTASGVLVDLLAAERAVVTPTGAVQFVPDTKVRLAAAESLLDRAGHGAVKRSDISISGADGGPVRVDHRHLHAELDALSPAELLARLQDQALGGA